MVHSSYLVAFPLLLSHIEQLIATGADVVGGEELVDAILKGKIDFDRCIASPDMMPLVGRVARVSFPAH